jgi:hypothetical protein
MRTLPIDGLTAVTGALALDLDFVHVLERRFIDDRVGATLLISPEAIFAGAYGAGLLAAGRFLRVLGSQARRGATVNRRRLRGVERLLLN